MGAKLPTPTAAQMLTNDALNRAHTRLLAQWGEEAPDTRDEHRHPEDFDVPEWMEE
jgi:hypothetical protein